jgi:hypothetical protein
MVKINCNHNNKEQVCQRKVWERIKKVLWMIKEKMEVIKNKIKMVIPRI